jgi:hypothetical protein
MVKKQEAKEVKPVTALTPLTAPEIEFSKELTDYKGLLEVRKELRAKKNKAYDALKDFVAPYITGRVAISYENCVSEIKVQKKIEEPEEDVKQLGLDMGYQIGQMFYKNTEQLKAVVGEVAYNKLKHAAEYGASLNGHARLDEAATKAKKEEYIKLVEAYKNVQLQVKDINEYVGFVDTVSGIARGTKRK